MRPVLALLGVLAAGFCLFSARTEPYPAKPVKIIIQSYLRGLGLEPATMTIEQFATRINTEMDKWAPLLKASRMPLKKAVNRDS